MKEIIISIIIAIYIIVALIIFGVLVNQDIDKNEKPVDLFLDLVFSVFWLPIFIIGRIFKV